MGMGTRNLAANTGAVLNDITDAELLRLCRERLPAALETTALASLTLARQYITKGIPVVDDSGHVAFYPPDSRQLKDICQSIKWVTLPEMAEQKVSDETIIDEIERSGMKLPSIVNVDTTEDAL